MYLYLLLQNIQRQWQLEQVHDLNCPIVETQCYLCREASGRQTGKTHTCICGRCGVLHQIFQQCEHCILLSVSMVPRALSGFAVDVRLKQCEHVIYDKLSIVSQFIRGGSCAEEFYSRENFSCGRNCGDNSGNYIRFVVAD